MDIFIDKKQLQVAIELDMLNGVYDSFPTLKMKLEKIVFKLNISNSIFYNYELQLLKENDYL